MSNTSERYRPAQIVSNLREAEVQLREGQSIAVEANQL